MWCPICDIVELERKEENPKWEIPNFMNKGEDKYDETR